MDNSTRKSQVNEQLDILRNAEETLESHINNLYDRLKPIMKEDSKQEKDEGEPETPALVPIAATVYEIKRKIINLTNKIVDITKRIEI